MLNLSGCFWTEYQLAIVFAKPLIRKTEYPLAYASVHGLTIVFSIFFQRVLNEAGYVPSNSEKYPLGGIISAIENAFHASPQIVCSKGSVEELRLCFYKDFKVGNLLNCIMYSAYEKLKYVMHIFVSIHF